MHLSRPVGRPVPSVPKALRAIAVVVAMMMGTGLAPVVAQSLDEPVLVDLSPKPGADSFARAVASGPEGLVAIGARSCRAASGQSRLRCLGEVWTSADGIDWQAVPRSDSGINLGTYCESTGASLPGLIDIAYGPAGYVAIGYVGSQRRCAAVAIWTSADGRTWARTDISGGFPLGFKPAALIATPDEYVVGGVVHGLDQDPPVPPRTAVWTSPDGTAWTRAKPARAFEVGGYLDTGEAPDSGGISALAASPGGYVAVGDACPRSFSGPYLNAFGSLPPACFGQSWFGAGTQAWSTLETPAVPDIIDVETIGSRVVAAASVCRACAPLMLIADVEPGSDPAQHGDWSFAYGSPVGGRLLDLTASPERFWAVMADADGSSLTLWSSVDGTRWEPQEPRLPLPEAMAFDERGGVDTVAASNQLVVVGSGATLRDEIQQSFAIAVPIVEPSHD